MLPAEDIARETAAIDTMIALIVFQRFTIHEILRNNNEMGKSSSKLATSAMAVY